jgi:hypothetical protein
MSAEKPGKDALSHSGYYYLVQLSYPAALLACNLPSISNFDAIKYYT